MFIFAKTIDMERDLLIELLEEGDKVTLYSPRFVGEDYTEFEKFLLAHKERYPKDLAQIIYRLDIAKRDGPEDRHFRYEGNRSDRVVALPSYLESTKLRVYLLNIKSRILILGNGGLKTTRTYEENPHLNRCVQDLQRIDIQLRGKELAKEIIVKGTALLGELSFTIETDDEED